MRESTNDNNGNKLRNIAVASGATIVALGAGALVSSGADCNPDLGDVCVPGVTIPVSPTMPEKGEEEESTTTTSEPEESTTTTSTVPETTTTVTTVPGE